MIRGPSPVWMPGARALTNASGLVIPESDTCGAVRQGSRTWCLSDQTGDTLRREQGEDADVDDDQGASAVSGAIRGRCRAVQFTGLDRKMGRRPRLQGRADSDLG